MNKFETIKETGSKSKKMSIGQIMDNLLENPEFTIKSLSKLLEDCKKVNEDLQIQLKNKQSEIDYLKGQLSVYQKFLNEKNEEHQKINGELREKVKELESDLYSANCIVKELTEENIKLKVLEDDIEDKRIAYIDTPEFEVNYIPKQKIKDKIKELSNTKGDFATYIAVSERIRALEEILQESEDK